MPKLSLQPNDECQHSPLPKVKVMREGRGVIGITVYPDHSQLDQGGIKTVWSQHPAPATYPGLCAGVLVEVDLAKVVSRGQQCCLMVAVTAVHIGPVSPLRPYACNTVQHRLNVHI